MNAPNAGQSSAAPIDAWEAAYLRFETREQERAKFLKRLRALGAQGWDRGLRILELCCGRGSGLDAWRTLGFERVVGLDLSAELVAAYEGDARIVLGDARRLPFADSSCDVVAVQGGLHHLTMMDDLESALAEVDRVLRPGGRFVIVEPWSTPFLQIVHAACCCRALRKLWGRLDALATMIEHERDTYEDWLSRPEAILAAIGDAFHLESRDIAWGKLMAVGRKRAA